MNIKKSVSNNICGVKHADEYLMKQYSLGAVDLYIIE